MSEGDTPLILEAWPIVSGLIRFNFSLASNESAWTLSYSKSDLIL
jgi:hypothetical protein